MNLFIVGNVDIRGSLDLMRQSAVGIIKMMAAVDVLREGIL